MDSKSLMIDIIKLTYLLKRKRGWKLSIHKIMTSSLQTIYPSFLVKKFGNVISAGQMMQIWDRWEHFLKTGAKPSQKTLWAEVKQPYFILEYGDDIKVHPSSQKTVKTQIVILNIIHKMMAGKIATFTQHYSPLLWSKQSK